jgi:hypothetical protein
MKSDTEIVDIVDRTYVRYSKITDADAQLRRAPGKWSRKEILGHLIDSAANNHQRIVRAVISGDVVLPPYAQVEWVSTQGYGGESWESILDFWAAYNRHLARVIGLIPPERRSATCRIGDKDPVTLEALVADYIRHLNHHLEQIDEGL